MGHICLWSAVFLSSVYSASHGPYFAEPYLVENKLNARPDKVTAYYYLQQINMSTVHLCADVNVFRPLGPLKAQVSNVYWTGSGFKRASGDSGLVNLPTACLKGVHDVLLEIKPTGSGQFHSSNCSFDQGRYETDVDLNELMHKQNQKLPYIPVRLTIKYYEKPEEILFGFAIEFHLYDLHLYNIRRSLE